MAVGRTIKSPELPGAPAPTGNEDLLVRVRRQEAEIQSLCAEVLERYEEATFVYRLADRIAMALGEAAIARVVVEDVVRVLGARRGEVWTRRGEMLRLAAFVGEGGSRDAVLAPEILAALQSGRPWTREGGGAEETSIAVPIPAPREEPIGLIVLHGRPGGRSYRAGETKLVVAVAALASAFLRNDRLAAKARLADARRREDEIARQVHRGLLPHQEPVFHGLDVSGGFRAAEIVGGDYYGYVLTDDGGLGVAIADVAGHGVGAALYMATAKGAIQAEARRSTSPAKVLERTNELLVGDFSGADLFATACFLRFAPGARRVVSANGGHHPALLVRADGAAVKLDCGGPALGIMPAATYGEEEADLHEGDVLFLYTDGLVEARNAEKRPYGPDRLTAVARRHRALTASAIRRSLLDDLDAHCGGAPPGDDVTVVVIKAVPRGSGDRS